MISAEGTNVLEYRSTDRAGNIEETQSMTLRIDKTAPELKIVSDLSELWPPNGKLIPIRMKVDASDSVSGIEGIRLIAITSSEADSGVNGEADIQEAEYGTDDRTFLLRAERNGEGSGRVYTIEYEVTDQAGHGTTKKTEVAVQHDQSK